ncbi:MAG: hypothetical protein ACI7YS_15025 [Flavobacterium sp.]
MSERVQLFLTVAISCFVLGVLVTFLSDYWKIGASAFDKLLIFDFYQEKIIHSLLFGLFWVYITWWSDKKQKARRQ